MALFSILKRENKTVATVATLEWETKKIPIYEIYAECHPYFIMWSQLYAQFQAMNCRCNSLAFVCMHLEVVVMLQMGFYMKWDKFQLSQFSWDQSADAEPNNR